MSAADCAAVPIEVHPPPQPEITLELGHAEAPCLRAWSVTNWSWVARLVIAVSRAHDEWVLAEHRYLFEESMAQLSTEPVTVEEVPPAISA
jgi:hypothetical protein